MWLRIWGGAQEYMSVPMAERHLRKVCGCAFGKVLGCCCCGDLSPGIEQGLPRSSLPCSDFLVCMQAKLRAVLQSWGDVVASSALTRQAAEARATELQQGLLHGVLCVWMDFVTGRKALSALAVRAVKKMSSLRLRLALDAWVEAVLMQRAYAADEGRACRWHARRRLRMCLASLQDNVCYAHETQATVSAILVRTSAARVAAAMAVWAAHTRHAAVLRCRAQSVSRNRDARLLAMAMFSWCGITQDALGARGKIHRMRRACDDRLQRAAFQEWATAAQSCASGRKLLATWAAEYTQGMLGLVVQSWWEQTQAAAARKEAAAAVSERRQTQLLSCMMTAWQRQSRAKALARELVVQALRRAAARHLRSCLLAWRSTCEHRAWRLAMLELGVQRRYSVMCGSVLWAWSAEVVRARLAQRGMARLQRRRELGTLQAHLRTWQQVVADNRRRMEGLKACIKRKKVAFQLFKAWYWDAFDSDVQETIRRMFHTTSSVTPSLPRPPLARPISRIPMPTSVSNPSLLGHQQQQQQQQQTIAAAAAAASGAARRSVNGPIAGPQVGPGGYRGGDINVHGLLRGSYRARYGGGEPDEAEHGHGSSSGVLMGAMPRRGWQASPGIGQRPGIYSTLPASQPPPRTSAPRPDPGTPTRAAWMVGAEQGEIPEGGATPEHLPGDGVTLTQGDMHSKGLSVAQQQRDPESRQQQQQHWESEALGLSSPELGSPVRKTPDVTGRQRVGNGFMEQSFLLGRYNDLFSESEGEDDVPLAFAK
ncbi:hypothetical protein DUNSADRAFT_2946 [Dunaliella salina]|uniref:Sfi1 spindle body domain-containing protein n=1 Tax=Dunaliella salina TaxID=3046 RepID=A0ABQ7GUW3_DUNSA|nr:hypothetical protein DUNSADRAFT_2946 [Dunaliella salina]|eukprot:KAF5838410.1 hypothetical protein DUNSADRAFT_2946 [Dunaliella salina]